MGNYMAGFWNGSYEIPGRFTHRLYKDVKWQDEYGASGWNRVESDIRDAEVVSSELVEHKGKHSIVLDIDVPLAVVASSTPGHSHLYIDQPMTWRRYKRILKALAAAGVIEKGYAKASIRRKHTAVRVPWLKKKVG